MNEPDPRIQSLAQEALALPENQRAAFLSEACGDDSILRDDVLQQMESMGKISGDMFASEKTLIDTTHGESEPLTDSHPKRISTYTIRRLIGSGGMGTVYEAAQDSPRRRVAIKVLKAGMSSRSALRRFEYESQVLGRLRHQGIAQIYEAGTWESDHGNVPWFAMEYIPNAKTLTEYAKDHRLSLHERLELFIKVCDAVHHGHQKGIIHRDLKPGNILVDSTGHPKVIDFGVARSTDSDMAVTTLQTSVGQLIGTVQYMSPEQCDADPGDLDTRSDVYTLGVILFELLTDSLPYQFGNKAIHEAARAIKEDAPHNPSTINRHLRGDVETIVLTALEKERDRRYQSAQALAEDISRFLRGDPINARPPSVLYQLQVLARKNRAAAVAAVSVFVVLVVAVVLVSLFAASQARQKKEADTAKLQAVHLKEEAVNAQKKLEEQVEAARTAKEDANLKANEASDAKALADQRAKEAEVARTQAEQASQSLLTANEQLEQQAYIASLIRAQNALGHQHPGEAARLLASSPDKYRHWEWGMLHAQADQSLHSTSIDGNWNSISNNGRYLFRPWSYNIEIHDRETGTTREYVASFVLPDGSNHAGSVQYLTISPDNRYLACFATHNDNESETTRARGVGLRVWDLQDASMEPIISKDGDVRAACFNPSSTHLAWTFTEDVEDDTIDSRNPAILLQRELLTNTLCIQSLEAPDAPHRVLEAPRGTIQYIDDSIAYASDGNHVAIKTQLLGISLVRLATGEVLQVGHPDVQQILIEQFGFTSNGKWLYCSERGGDSLRLIDVETGHAIDPWVAVQHAGITDITSIPGHDMLITGDSTGTIRLIRLPGGELAGTRHGHLGSISDIAVSDDGSPYSLGDDRTIRKWDLEQKSNEIPATYTSKKQVDHVELKEDGRLLLAASGTMLEIWSLDLDRKLISFPLPANLRDMEISPDGRYVALSLGDRAAPLAVHDLQTGWPLDLDVEGGTVIQTAASYLGQPLRFSHDGRTIAFGHGNQLLLLDLDADRTIVQSVELESFDVRAFSELRFTAEGDSVLALSVDGSLYEWHPKTGEIKQRLKDKFASAFALSPNGKFLASGNGTGQVNVRALDTSELESEFTPRGAHIADVAMPLLTEGYGLPVHGLCFTPDGNRLAVTWKDGTLSLFDVTTREQILTLMNPALLKPHSHEGDVLDLNENQVLFGEDGTSLVMSSGPHLYVWSSQSPGQRETRRQEAQQRSTMAQAIASGLLAEGDLEKSIESIRNDPAIDESLRHAALIEIMLQSSPWPLFEEERYEEAKDRQMALYRQLRDKYGIEDTKTQHVLSDLIQIYRAMGNHRTAQLLAKKLSSAGN
ncbi:MAG: protein kinase [Phycisphaerales bacterium]|nr:protein kinase [Phycisphaerales bacterium]